jgi:hypothetical protein
MNVTSAPDPYEALSIRTKFGLGVIASLFDRITYALIERKLRLAQKDRNTMDVEETRKHLTATYCRLEADAEIGELARHIADKSTYDYWQQFRVGGWADEFYAIASFRDEALDTYEVIATELEKNDTIALLELSNAIRLKLRSLEPYLEFWKLKHQKMSTRKRIEARSTKIDNTPKAR